MPQANRIRVERIKRLHFKKLMVKTVQPLELVRLAQKAFVANGTLYAGIQQEPLLVQIKGAVHVQGSLPAAHDFTGKMILMIIQYEAL
jgi:hypothetical protein